MSNHTITSKLIAARRLIDEAMTIAASQRIPVNHSLGYGLTLTYSPPKIMTKQAAIDYLASGKTITPTIRAEIKAAIENDVKEAQAAVDDWETSTEIEVEPEWEASWNSSNC